LGYISYTSKLLPRSVHWVFHTKTIRFILFGKIIDVKNKRVVFLVLKWGFTLLEGVSSIPKVELCCLVWRVATVVSDTEQLERWSESLVVRVPNSEILCEVEAFFRRYVKMSVWLHAPTALSLNRASTVGITKVPGWAAMQIWTLRGRKQSELRKVSNLVSLDLQALSALNDLALLITIRCMM